MTEDEMAGWHHQLDGHEFEQPLGVGDGQGGLACCDSWGHKESDTTERLDSTEVRETQRLDSTYIWNLKKDTNELIYKTETSDCIAQGALLNVMWQPRWDRGLGENGYMHMCG